MANDPENGLLVRFGDVIQFRTGKEAEDEAWSEPCVVLEVSGAIIRVSRLLDIGERAVLGLSSKEWGVARLMPGRTAWTLDGVASAQAEHVTQIPEGADAAFVAHKLQRRGELADQLVEILRPLEERPPALFTFSTSRPENS